MHPLLVLLSIFVMRSIKNLSHVEFKLTRPHPRQCRKRDEWHRQSWSTHVTGPAIRGAGVEEPSNLSPLRTAARPGGLRAREHEARTIVLFRRDLRSRTKTTPRATDLGTSKRNALGPAYQQHLHRPARPARSAFSACKKSLARGEHNGPIPSNPLFDLHPSRGVFFVTYTLCAVVNQIGAPPDGVQVDNGAGCALLQ